MPKKNWIEEWRKEAAKIASKGGTSRGPKTALQSLTGCSKTHEDGMVYMRLRERRESILDELRRLETGVLGIVVKEVLELEKIVAFCRVGQKVRLRKIRASLRKAGLEQEFPALFKPASWSRS